MVDNSETSKIQFVSLFSGAESGADTGRTSGPNSNSVSNVSNVKPTRRRTTLEVVILLKKVKPAYHVTGTFFGDDAEDQSITRAQVMKEVRNGNQEEDQDYEGDVDGDAGINEDDEMVSSRPNSQC